MAGETSTKAIRRKDYRTKSSVAVRELLESSRGAHLTAEDIFRNLTQKGISMGLTTVYRQLEKLTEEGVVRNIYGDKQGYCYQAVAQSCQVHYHMVCTDCGKLLHLDCDKAGNLFSHITEQHGFRIDPGRTVLYGLCSGCHRKNKQKESC